MYKIFETHFLRMRCLYCLSPNIAHLKGTCYCRSCHTYFKIENGELEPIYMPNNERYMKQAPVKEKQVLCSVCQEREEKEHLKRREEEEHRMQIIGSMPYGDKSRSSDTTVYLCKICIAEVNKVLKKSEDENLPGYLRYLRRKRAKSALIFALVLLSLRVNYFLLGNAAVILWNAAQSVSQYRRKFAMSVVLFSALFAIRRLSWIYSVYLFIADLFRYAPKRTKYVRSNFDIAKMERSVIRQIRKMEIEEKKREEEREETGAETKKRSFVHAAYTNTVKTNEELKDLCKRIEELNLEETKRLR